MLWLQGVYFHEAVSVAVSKALYGKKAAKFRYPEKPFESIVPLNEKEKEAKRIQDIKKTISFFDMLAGKHGGKRYED